MATRQGRGWTRRTFLEASAAVAAALPIACSSDGKSTAAGGAANGGSGTGGGSTGGNGAGGGATGGQGGTANGGTNSGGAAGSGSGSASLVGLARAATTGDAVRAAIALTSGLGFIRSGDTVLLKPNLNSGDPSPYSTNPDIVQAVIELVRDHGATRVIIGDRSNPAYNTLDAMQRSGITAVGTALGVEMIDLNDQPTRAVTPAGATNWPNGFTSYAMLFDEVDHVINLCCCKHHSMANFTMALKAWMGIIVQNDRSTAHSDLGNRLPELHLALRESFVVMDATQIVLTRGPNPGGQTAAPGIVVASADPVANDVTGLAILKHWLSLDGIANQQIDNYTVWSQPQIQRALAIGLGIGAQSDYNAKASGVDEFDALMQLVNA